MNKQELIDAIAKSAAVSKTVVKQVLDSYHAEVKGSLKKGKPVQLIGFGTFSVSKRAARKGRNPKTGAVLNIKAAKVPKFKPGKALKDSVN